MWFSSADAAAIGRCLAQVADQATDIVDLFLERRYELEMRSEETGPGVVARRDEGFAIRLVRDGHTHLVARDGFEAGALESALREVARVIPSSAYSVPELATLGPPEIPAWDEFLDFQTRVRQAVRERHAAFDFRVRVAHHRRRVQLVGRRLMPEPETEAFFSLACSTPWGGFGTLTPELDDDCVAAVAKALVGRFRARGASVIGGFAGPIVLAPAATAVLLHEAVAHALETDTLVLSGRPEAAVGVALGSDLLDVLDSPGDMPPALRRETDDEGLPVLRRWLLRRGCVSQVLADRFHAGLSPHLLPGAARRASRHLPPVPRSTHLELVPGDHDFADLLEGASGIYFSEISRGRLDPLSGELVVEFPHGRRFRAGRLGDWVGRCVLRGKASQVLSAVEAIGDESEFAGAGWCAKAGHRLPVWATCAHLRLSGLEIGQ